MFGGLCTWVVGLYCTFDWRVRAVYLLVLFYTIDLPCFCKCSSLFFFMVFSFIYILCLEAKYPEILFLPFSRFQLASSFTLKILTADTLIFFFIKTLIHLKPDYLTIRNESLIFLQRFQINVWHITLQKP